MVEVRQGTLSADGRGCGPAGNTGRGWSWLRSGHSWTRTTRRTRRTRRRGREDEEEEEDEDDEAGEIN